MEVDVRWLKLSSRSFNRLIASGGGGVDKHSSSVPQGYNMITRAKKEIKNKVVSGRSRLHHHAYKRSWITLIDSKRPMLFIFFFLLKKALTWFTACEQRVVNAIARQVHRLNGGEGQTRSDCEVVFTKVRLGKLREQSGI